MRVTTIPRLDRPVSVVGSGCWGLSGPDVWTSGSDASGISAVRRAVTSVDPSNRSPSTGLQLNPGWAPLWGGRGGRVVDLTPDEMAALNEAAQQPG